MNKFIRIAIEIEAMQIGIPFVPIAEWCGGSIYQEGPTYRGINVETSLNSFEVAMPGEWIIKFPEGNFIILSDELFKKNYIQNENLENE